MVATSIQKTDNALFGHRNYVLSGALSASSSVAGLGVENLQNDQGSAASAWQTAVGVLTASLLIDAGGIAPWRMFGFFRSNATIGANVRWRLSNSPDMSNPVLDTGWGNAGVKREYLQHVFCPRILPAFVPEPAPVLVSETEDVIVTAEGDNIAMGLGPSSAISIDQPTDTVIDEFLGEEDGTQVVTDGTGIPSGGPLLARYCLFEIEDLNNDELFLNIPFIYAGDAWEPSRQISSESSWGMDAVVLETTTRGGQEFPDFQHMKRRWEIAMDSLATDEVFVGLAEVLRFCARGRNVLFVPFPHGDNRNYEAVYGRLSTKSDVTFRDKSGAFRAFRATVTERL